MAGMTRLAEERQVLTLHMLMFIFGNVDPGSPRPGNAKTLPGKFILAGKLCPLIETRPDFS
jgi:hypothetical protein